ncbi:TPA: tyrosine-type recombinase/integrase [Citrobacter sedlakii]|nr:tyrosine-type recombinase/integrase [Citrobacter sedlakii]HCA7137721.1 tyrosine-type recombinase/integrase [Citrobacter sedlakii]HCA7183855.1 tyrosine-type recombinase/integrase [Citrobacter sedlakii]
MSQLPREILQISRSDAWLNPGNAPLPSDTARAMRDYAAQLGGQLPKYLLAPEVAVLLSYLPDHNQRMYFDTLWNTGARPGEALAMRPVDFVLEPTRQHPQPLAVVKTLKQREREASRPPGRPRKEAEPVEHPDSRYRKPPEPVTRLVPLLDAGYALRMREFLATWRKRVKHQAVWPITSRQTPVNWLNAALLRAESDGVTFPITVTPHTFRHSFAMHLLMNGVPQKVLQGLLGHRYSRSTEAYTRVFALDVLAMYGVRFSMDSDQARRMLRIQKQY